MMLQSEDASQAPDENSERDAANVSAPEWQKRCEV